MACAEDDTVTGFTKSLYDYKFHHRIATGAFSTIYKATCKQNLEAVAIKRVKLLEVGDEKTRFLCLEEVALLQRLDHTNIIKYHTSFVMSDELFLVLELADFGDLDALLDRCLYENCLLSENAIWMFFCDICHGLQHMHYNRIMHRDIKPANVFITSKGVAKLGDLGLGRHFGPTTMFASSMLGTAYYMSAERLFGANYNFSSDVWSMGCLLYEMTALRPPFATNGNISLVDLCRAIQESNYVPIPEPMYSDQLLNLMKSCLNMNPEERPDSEYLVSYADSMYTYTKPK